MGRSVVLLPPALPTGSGADAQDTIDHYANDVDSVQMRRDNDSLYPERRLVLAQLAHRS
jgi:hypothetical protein